jgi:copper(I)-binding protein
MKPLFRAAVLGVLISLTAACNAENDAGKAAAPKAAAVAAKAADSVKVENPYARAVPPGQPNSGAFMTFVNAGDVDHSVKSAASPVAATVELHTHTNNNGVMEMRQVPQIDVPAKGRTELAPGGLHVMLIGLKQDLKAGENAQITLTFEDGSTTVVNAPIKEVTPPAMGGMHH